MMVMVVLLLEVEVEISTAREDCCSGAILSSLLKEEEEEEGSQASVEATKAAASRKRGSDGGIVDGLEAAGGRIWNKDRVSFFSTLTNFLSVSFVAAVFLYYRAG